jgi:hypothetical protein
VFDGVTGIVRKPIEGAKKEGVEGFFKGNDFNPNDCEPNNGSYNLLRVKMSTVPGILNSRDLDNEYSNNMNFC